MRIILNRLMYMGLLALPVLVGCSDSNNNDNNDSTGSSGNIVTPLDDKSTVYAAANSCVAISPDHGTSFLAESAGTFELSAASAAEASRFVLRPSDLGKYLLYDENEGYLVSDGATLLRQDSLNSEFTADDTGKVLIEDGMQSEGEWQLLAAPDDQFVLQHLKSGMYVGSDGTMVAEGESAGLTFVEQSDCATFPELSVDATGEIAKTQFEDGAVFGFVETHSHLFTNLAFGGGGVFHGAPYHPLGVEHALHDCDLTHGFEGKKDIMGAGFSGGKDINAILPALFTGELPEKDHNTDGYPTFSDWPNAPSSPTHQMQYYKWLERAYMSGLRLLVQHATTNETLCKLTVGIGAQSKRHDCNDMINVDAILDATIAMERYIDAQAGGPGEGWFRIVYSPEEAREEIKAGNLAVVLGIETSVLFDCYLFPPDGYSKCTEADVVDKLDEYYAKGVRVLFPVHKYDNAFSAGDGDRNIIDIGNFGHTGHYSNFIECPAELLTFPGGFDSGGASFSALNRPRDVFDAPPVFDVTGLEQNVLGAMLPLLDMISSPPLKGEYCQNHGLTDLGEFLITEMMKRGIILEVDHLPRKSYARAYEILEANDYPAMGTHGRNNNGRIYKLGGMSKANLGRCRSADKEATMDDGFQSRINLIREMGGYPAEGFGFDLNGFAGAPGPRFGENANCSSPQTDEGITYPFTSYAGDVELQRPVVGERTLDFNTEGMVHLGLVAELIEDVRRDGVSDEELEPLYRSAEGYLRVWEKSQRRAAEMAQ